MKINILNLQKGVVLSIEYHCGIGNVGYNDMNVHVGVVLNHT